MRKIQSLLHGTDVSSNLSCSAVCFLLINLPALKQEGVFYVYLFWKACPLIGVDTPEGHSPPPTPLPVPVAEL
jgi:hypothetical protein